jgi:hypothetical protein
MIKIELIQFGDTYPVNYQKIENFGNNSSIFKIINILENKNHEILNSEILRISDENFKFLTNIKTDADFSVIIVNRPLDGNYFSRRISNKLIVISIFGIETLNIHEGISLEMYILRFLLAFTTIYNVYNGLPINANELMQKNPTGCLFDMCIYKPQISFFFRNPKLSSAVVNTLTSKTLPKNFLNNLKKEIKLLKIGNYYQLTDWLKENPKKAIFFTFLIGLIFSELLGNYIYDLISKFLPFIETNCK